MQHEANWKKKSDFSNGYLYEMHMDTFSDMSMTLLRKVVEGKVEGKKTRGIPRTMLLDHLTTKNGNRSYGQLKEMAPCREEKIEVIGRDGHETLKPETESRCL